MSFSEHRLKSWLERCCLKRASLRNFQLCHAPGSERYPVGQAEIDCDDSDLGAAAAQCATQIADAATEHAEGLGGRQRYVVQAIEDGASIEEHTQTISPSSDVSSVDIAPTNDTPPELLYQGAKVRATSLAPWEAQMMRHDERMHQLMVRQSTELTGFLTRRCGELEKRNAELLDHRFEALGVMESLLSRKHERDMEITERERNEARKDSIVGLIAELAPHLLAIVRGNSPTVTALRTVVKGLDEATVAGLLAELEPDGREAFTALLLQLADSEEAKKNIALALGKHLGNIASGQPGEEGGLH